jgi:hypothetical protein
MHRFMRSLGRLVAGLVLMSVCVAPALAQVPGLPNPDLQNRIPAPLPPPPQPPIINGPLSQSPPPGVYVPPRLDTHSDRTVACVQAGSGRGLRGRKLDAYTRACANQ